MEQALFVLAWDGAYRPDATSASRVQVLATPDQSLDLIVASRHPSFRYVRRSETDSQLVPEDACSR
ncbi:MAG: hypothetical protein H6736_01515 [Alphaproteobacteria bacterium]|nr:hypothetical protein [Alphaproteobacteria bacterium]